jgi:hypothetical protein
MRMRVSGFVSAVCLGVVLTTIASTAAAVRTVDLSLTLPGGERPQLTIAEGRSRSETRSWVSFRSSMTDPVRR